MEEAKRKSYHQIVVELIDSFFDCHDELKCCKNKSLAEGTMRQVKKNAQKIFDDQFK